MKNNMRSQKQPHFYGDIKLGDGQNMVIANHVIEGVQSGLHDSGISTSSSSEISWIMDMKA